MYPVPKPSRTERGFTLIELLIVVLLLGVLGALTVPGFRTVLVRHQLDTTARILAADIREIQERVLNEESADEFRIHFREDRYTILRNTRVQNTVYLPDGVCIVSAGFGNNDMRVWFRNGSVSPRDGGGTVVLRHKATGLESRVVVKPVTGRVRVENCWEVPRDQE